MNEVVTTGTSEIVKTGTAGLSGVRQLQDRLLQPRRECVEFLRATNNLRYIRFRSAEGIWSESPTSGPLLSVVVDRAKKDLARDQERARSWLEQAPSPDVVESYLATFEAALEASGDRASIELLIAILFDGFPNARLPSPEACIEATAMLVEEEPFETGEPVSIYALAAAVPRILRENTFVPTAQEVLRCYRECRDEFAAARNTAKWIMEEYVKAEGVLSINIDDYVAHVVKKVEEHERITEEERRRNIEARRR